MILSKNDPTKMMIATKRENIFKDFFYGK